MTSVGNLRRHNHAGQAAFAARQARLNDPKLIGTADGSELRVDDETLRTVVAAKNAWLEHMWWAEVARIEGRHGALATRQGYADTILAALAAKWGVNAEQARVSLRKALDRKLRDLTSRIRGAGGPRSNRDVAPPAL